MKKLCEIEKQMENAIACNDIPKYLELRKEYSINKLKQMAQNERERNLKDLYIPERSIPTFINGKLVKQ